MYNKLFGKILDSSIWLEDPYTRIVWITLLAAMDQDGYAHFSAIENLANRARIPLDKTKIAVKKLAAPDSESGDPAHEGRRIERVPGGFVVLNAGKHRELATRIIQREQTRLRVAKHRETKKADGSGEQCNAPVTPSEAKACPVAKSNKSKPLSCKQDNVTVQDVFKSWQTTLNHPRSVLDNKRRAKIKQALKDYTKDDLIKAFQGCSKSPFHMGENDRKQKYDDITLILRDSDHIERFMEFDDKPPSKPTKPFNPREETRPRKPLS